MNASYVAALIVIYLLVAVFLFAIVWDHMLYPATDQREVEEEFAPTLAATREWQAKASAPVPPVVRATARPVDLDRNTSAWPVNTAPAPVSAPAQVDGVKVGTNPVQHVPVQPAIDPAADDFAEQIHALNAELRAYAAGRATDPDATGFMPRIEDEVPA